MITAPCAIQTHQDTMLSSLGAWWQNKSRLVCERVAVAHRLSQGDRAVVRTAACKRVGLASLQAAGPFRHADHSVMCPAWTRLLFGSPRDSSTWTWGASRPLSTYDLQTDVRQPSRQVYAATVICYNDTWLLL